jgi:hypothetical protein
VWKPCWQEALTMGCGETPKDRGNPEARSVAPPESSPTLAPEVKGRRAEGGLSALELAFERRP